MRRSLLFIAILAASAVAAAAQSNDFLDTLLDSGTVTMGQASYLALSAVDKLGGDEEADAGAAFAAAQGLGWVPKSAQADDPIRYSAYAYLLARAFDLKGGIMFSIFRSPRYAYRELVFRQAIQGRTDPQAEVDGPAAVRILNRVMDSQGGAK